jgi:deoxyribonuclease V
VLPVILQGGLSSFMHPWNISAGEAIDIQRRLSKRILFSGIPEKIQCIAGVDLAFDKKNNLGFCGIVLLGFPDLDIIQITFYHDEVHFPYIPGLLSFREGPIFLKTFELLEKRPDLIIFDGQGIAHPRRLGIASHMGLLLNISTIGCAKSRLYGSYEEPGREKGARSYLFDRDGERIGMVLRTRYSVKPVFVSPGYMAGIEESADIIMQCVNRYRIPEPIRVAHKSVGEYKRSFLRG